MQSENKGERIGVTGATGRVGSHLVESSRNGDTT